MARELELEVANFVCHFGDELVMNDLLHEVVLPAFFSDKVRSIRGTDYFFINQKLIYLEKDNLDSVALCCRFVKNTVLKRYQVYSKAKGIVQDKDSMKSAPTSIVVLLLKPHRLLFVKEVPNAPSFYNFGATFKNRMRDEVLNYHSAQYESAKSINKPVTKKSLREKFPIPDVHVTPITSNEKLNKFINRFEKLTTMNLELAPTNNELDLDEFFEDSRDAKDQVGSKTTRITHHNPDGLNKKGCLDQASAAKQGNLNVAMRGKDKNGDILNGNNDDFSLKASLGTQEMSFEEGIKKAYSKYDELKKEKIVVEGPQHNDYAEKLREAFNLF